MKEIGSLIGEGEVIDVKGLLKAGAALAEINETKEMLYAIVPSDYSLAVHDMARRNRDLDDEKKVIETGRPLRHTGIQAVADVDSFLLMVKRESIPETTIIHASLDSQNFMAIINHASDGQTAGHSDRKISLTLKKTSEFVRWQANNRRRFNQRDLADFLEENIDSITEPDANEIINMISNLKVKRTRDYHSVVDVESGNQSVTFSDTVKGEVVNGTQEFLGKFKIAVPPFQGAKRYNVDCRLRFGVAEGEQMVVYFSMLNLDAVLEHAFEVENDLVREAVAEMELEVVNVP
jgi:uncharacterized protein YfdQ (DUF2303 family)